MRVHITSHYPKDEVRDLLELASAGFDTRGVAVNVKNSAKPYGGRAYHSVPALSPHAKDENVRFLVTLRIGKARHFPLPNPYGHSFKRAPRFVMRDWREALVALAAHELMHIEQFRTDARRSEIACEGAAAGALARYREHAELPFCWHVELEDWARLMNSLLGEKRYAVQASEGLSGGVESGPP